MMIVITIPVVSALELCEPLTNPSDIPCMIVSTWEYDNCTATNVKIYNSTPTEVYATNFTNYGITGFCNFTWNISSFGSYVWNVSNGDTGHIIVEGDDKMNIAIAIVFSIFAVLLIGIGSYLLLRRPQDG